VLPLCEAAGPKAGQHGLRLRVPPTVAGPSASYMLARSSSRVTATRSVSPCEVAVLAAHQPPPEGVTEEVEAGVLRLPGRFASLQNTTLVLSG
jgi:hypothetical protein